MKLAIRGGNPVRRASFPQWPIFGETEKAALLRVLESQKWGSIQGEETRAFEKEFAAFQDADYGVATNSGTSALEIALRAAGTRVGDEVIVPAYTFVATATAALANGAIPVFADIGLETFNVDPASVESCISERTRAIVPVHFGGRPADMDALVQLAKKHDLVLIEDAAQAWGASWRGRKVGAIGDLGCFSFQSSKNVSAGEGGIILTNDDEYLEAAKSYVNCGRVEGGVWYAHYHLGGNSRMTEFQSALLRAQLGRYPGQLEMRRSSMQALDKSLPEIPGITPLLADERVTGHACHLYIFRYHSTAFDSLSKSEFIDALRAEGIPCSGGYSIPLYEQPLFQHGSFGPFTSLLRDRVKLDHVALENAHRACYDEAVWLPQYVLLDGPAGMQSVVEAISKIYEYRHELL